MKPRPVLFWLLFLAVLFVIIPLFWKWEAGRPSTSILAPDGPAVWARVPEPAIPNARPLRVRKALFLRRFDHPPQLERTVVHVAAFRSCDLRLNGHPLLSGGQGAPWYEGADVDLAPYLIDGTNELVAEVENGDGPPAFLLRSAHGLGLSTPEGWTVSPGGDRWFPALDAASPRSFPITCEYPSALEGLAHRWPLVGELVLLALCLGFWQRFRKGQNGVGPLDWWTPERFRYLLGALYILLCANNLFRLHWGFGYDAPAHYSYVEFLLREHRLPLATEGWQMFQSPLFYLLAAGPYELLRQLSSEEAARGLIRGLPMLCGLGLLEISFRMARLLFPGRRDLQRLATAVGGFLPMNLYMSQYFGNEPLAALLSALAIYLGLKLYLRSSRGPSAWEALLLGAVLGSAILAKVTPLLLVLPLAALVLWTSWRADPEAARALSRTGAFGAVCAVVAGWYFVRNWLLMGRPFIGGWEGRPNLQWWQDPGYRVSQDFIRFGHALLRPIYSSIYGFWDGLYSTLWLDACVGATTGRAAGPFWDANLLCASAILALPVATLVLAGAIRAMGAKRDEGSWALRFLLTCMVLYLGAMLLMFLQVPSYASVKASYGLAFTPAIGVLAAVGAEPLLGRPGWATAVRMYLFCWTSVVYLTYFAV